MAATIVVDMVYGSLVSVPPNWIVSRFPHTTLGFGLLVIGACVLAPLFEETFFRGFLFQGLASWRGAFWGAVISSALWSAGHLRPPVRRRPAAGLGLSPKRLNLDEHRHPRGDQRSRRPRLDPLRG